MGEYNPQKIEAKWQKRWEEEKLYQGVDFDKKKQKFYALIEFPYPSGAGLHVGHVRSWAAMDAYSRRKRMEGFNVLFPVGWDAFGLPTENYAIKNKIHPSSATEQNIATFKRQIKSIGLSFDWPREINTTDPKYYKWTQWIFLQLFKKGLAYQAEVPVNWCPFCKTNLADEEVLTDGSHERCGQMTEKRPQKQWLIKITKYAERLLEDLKRVDYSKKIATQQINWIGKREGVKIRFAVVSQEFQVKEIEVFTTRPDTLFGATFLVLAPEHPLSLEISRTNQEIHAYIEKVKKESVIERENLEREKTGVFTGVFVINPVNEKKMPIWVADYVLGSYGTGAIMAVPAHDERDSAFAQKYDLPVKLVVEPVTGEPSDNEEYRKSIVAIVRSPKTGKLVSINWGKENGGNLFVGGGLEDVEDVVEGAKREVEEETGYKNLKFVARSERVHHHYVAFSKGINRNIDAYGVLFELENEEKDAPALQKDEQGKFVVEWITLEEAEQKISDPLHKYVFEELIRGRRFVGEGIVVNSAFLDGLTTQEAKKKIIEWLEQKKFGFREATYHLRDWVFSRQHYWGEPIPIIHCPKCGQVSVPEDQLPLELPYVERYEPMSTGESPLAAIDEWVKVPCPECGGKAKRETDTMPNWAGSNWYFVRYLDPDNDKALASSEKMKYWLPVDIYQGGFEHTTLHLLYSRFVYKFLYDIGAVPTAEPYKKRRSHGIVLGPDNRKMSKSFGNVVNPDEIVKQFGADSLRLYEMFMGPFDQQVAWSSRGLQGCFRFLKKVWVLFEKNGWRETDAELKTKLHQTIKKITKDIEELRFNTAVAALMELVNLWQAKNAISKEDAGIFLKLLAPFAPHVAEELWVEVLQNGFSIHQESWPEANSHWLKEKMTTIIIQVNGKVRGEISIESAEATRQDQVEEMAKKEPRAAKFLEGKKIKKAVFVSGRLINFVLEQS